MDTTDQLKFRDGVFLPVNNSCSCGRPHASTFARVVVADGVLGDLAAAIAENTAGGPDSTVCIVADRNTFKVAGEEVRAYYAGTGANVRVCFLDDGQGDKPVKADEFSIGALAADMGRDVHELVAVGSGTITDVTRVMSARTGIPFVSVPTAPSVDAYTSAGSPVVRNGYKATVEGVQARLVLADTAVLRQAPAVMIASGLGDTVAKLVARCDWRLENLMDDTYFCPEIDQAVMAGAKGAVDQTTELPTRELGAIQALAESLMISGDAMHLAGSSRPASGIEHAISHYWEMKAHPPGSAPHPERGKLLHGTKVGIGSVLMAHLLARFSERLLRTDPATLDAGALWKTRRSYEDAENGLVAALGPLAEILLSETTRPRMIAQEAVAARIEKLRASWEAVVSIVSDAPSANDITGWIRAAGGPALPSDIGVGPDELRETLYAALEVRHKYNVLSACEDLGWLDEVIDEVVQSV